MLAHLALVVTRVVKVVLVLMVRLARLVLLVHWAYPARWVYLVDRVSQVIKDRMALQDLLVDMLDSTSLNTVRQQRCRCVHLEQS